VRNGDEAKRNSRNARPAETRDKKGTGTRRNANTGRFFSKKHHVNMRHKVTPNKDVVAENAITGGKTRLCNCGMIMRRENKKVRNMTREKSPEGKPLTDACEDE